MIKLTVFVNNIKGNYIIECPLGHIKVLHSIGNIFSAIKKEIFFTSSVLPFKVSADDGVPDYEVMKNARL